MKNKVILSVLAFVAWISTFAMMTMVDAANLSTNLAWCTANSWAINISYTECQSLAYFFDETNGNSWHASGNWFSNTDVTLWKGSDGTNIGNAITISWGHVITLTLNDNYLRGSIQSGVIWLPYLSGLSISQSFITGLNTSGLSALRSLDIGINGAMEADFTHTTGLIYLNVYYNS